MDPHSCLTSLSLFILYVSLSLPCSLSLSLSPLFIYKYISILPSSSLSPSLPLFLLSFVLLKLFFLLISTPVLYFSLSF